MNGKLEERVVVNGAVYVLCDDGKTYICDTPDTDFMEDVWKNFTMSQKSDEEQNIEARKSLITRFMDDNQAIKGYSNMIDQFIDTNRPWVKVLLNNDNVIKEMFNKDYDLIENFEMQLACICQGIAICTRKSWESVYGLGNEAISEEKIQYEIMNAIYDYLNKAIPPTPPKYKYLDKRAAAEI